MKTKKKKAFDNLNDGYYMKVIEEDILNHFR